MATRQVSCDGPQAKFLKQHRIKIDFQVNPAALGSQASLGTELREVLDGREPDTCQNPPSSSPAVEAFLLSRRDTEFLLFFFFFNFCSPVCVPGREELNTHREVTPCPATEPAPALEAFIKARGGRPEPQPPVTLPRDRAGAAPTMMDDCISAARGRKKKQER